jgi:hypothetical protein
MGAPMSDAILETLQDIPSRVPSLERSGVMFAKAADGTVTRAAEKKPGRYRVSECSLEGVEGLTHPIK